MSTEQGSSLPTKLGAWLAAGTTAVAITASGVNVWLTLKNAEVKARIDEREFALRELEADLKRGQAELEQAKERTERYRFVQSLLPDLVSGDSGRRVLTINIIRLTLTDEEAERLFAGFVRSSDAELRQAGQAAIADIQTENSKLQQAAERERLGFENLAAGKLDEVLNNFAAAEKADPT